MGGAVVVSSSDTAALKLVLSGIKNGATRVLSKSINSSIKTTQTQAVKLIGQELNLTAKRIKEDFHQEKANFSKLRGALVASGEPVGLINFKARQVKKGVSQQVKKSDSRTVVEHAFISTVRSGKHVFKRTRTNLPAPTKYKTGVKSGAPWPRMGKKYQGIGGGLSKLKVLNGPRIEDIYDEPVLYNKVLVIAATAYVANVGKETATLLRRFG